ncbi:unnamed protein product [Malus baccata var. baccata]
MPITPYAHIWHILLSACNTNRNIDLGRVTARKLLELELENESAHILLSKSLCHSWHRECFSKDLISSWLRFQVGGVMRYFFADDKPHHESKEIHTELIRLYRQISVT